MKNYFTLGALAFFLFLNTSAYSQNILNRIEKTVQGVENIKRNEEKRKEKEKNKPNTKSVAKSNFHQQYMGKITFAKGTPNAKLEDANQFVQTLDLSQPSYMNAYLPDPLYVIKAQKQKIGEYDHVTPAISRNYYINNQLIASYTDVLDDEIFKKDIVLSDVFVPSSQSQFEENKFLVGLLAHVLSSLNSGTHRLKVEYQMVISEARPARDGSAATEFDNKYITVAEGEVDVKFTEAELNSFVKSYGRPKYNKGVLQGDSKLENQVIDIIKANYKKTPVYVYADDNWTLERNYLDRVISRKVQIYYVYKTETGRCQVDNLAIKQNFDGQSYYAPVETINAYGKPFKFVVCQNY